METDQPKPTGEGYAPNLCKIHGTKYFNVCPDCADLIHVEPAKPAGEWTPESVGAIVGETFCGAWAIAEAHNAELEGHCKDCCCAKSWEALGITESTGMSIPEHIQQLREQLAAEREKVASLEEANQKFKMSDQPKPTGEWTVERIAWFIQEYGVAWQVKLADAHNAALAAEREKVQKLEEQLRKQLRQEKNTLVDALKLAEIDLRLAFGTNKDSYGYSKGLVAVVAALASYPLPDGRTK